jgi:hypothetical protein
MKDKLTLSIEQRLLAKAKRLARKRNTTLSREFEKMIEHWEITDLKQNQPEHPLVRAIFGNPVAIGKNYQQLKDDFYGKAGKSKK